jgi:hypothetical protein
MASKWDLKKKDDNYWQLSPTPDPDYALLAGIILFIIFLIVKYPDKIINWFK